MGRVTINFIIEDISEETSNSEEFGYFLREIRKSLREYPK